MFLVCSLPTKSTVHLAVRLQRVVGLGAIELSVAALLTHPTSDNVLHGATGLLAAATACSSEYSDAVREAAQQHVARAVNAGAVQAIVAAVQARPASLVVAVAAVDASVQALHNIIRLGPERK